ncbi:acetylornithine deacetylase/succinyl-diaminopimelate desuccinylase [Nocardia tenerifensis]|uniref:Probable succinyl-diaminopimelate desuccinylase n=1 Tax=Nocardia tenerifensis TaxID=228006 RepID=A0A318KE21_9NOCA|nr:ArgE/DapE family deacylase [Nocardia tenerifensis]PXX69350.1 acetylornithine deacetylase/succinyl-diaminopimelate desuccinylase [Nocardia tenerifensis]
MTIDFSTRVQAWLEPRADEMAELLTTLVAHETENPPGRGLRDCAAALTDAMAALGLDGEIIGVPPVDAQEDPCIVRATVGSGAKTLYFHGHFDVVPVQDRAQFTARRADGKIIGRGTADMKGGIVSMLYGAAAARELDLLGDGKIVVHLVCDEETGSVAGSGYLREHGLIDPRAVAMVTAEPSAGKIWHAARGAVSLRVTVHGREAHVGQANFGINSFQHMVRIAAPLENYVRSMMNRHTGFEMDAEDARGSMVVVGGLSGGGSNFNVVPGTTWFTIDSRFNPEEDLEVELKNLTTLLETAADDIGAEVTVEVTQFQPPAGTERDDPAGQALAQCVSRVTGEQPAFEMCAGILDTRWYAQLGIPAFAYGAGRLDVSHGPNEYVDELKLRRTAAVYALYAREMLD